MRASLGGGGGGGGRNGVCKVKNNLSEKSKKSNSIKFRISQNSGLESQKSQSLTHGTKESQTFPQSICQRSQKLFTEMSRVNLVSSKSRKSKKSKPPCRPPLLVVAVNKTGMFLLQSSSEVCRTF